MKKAIAVLIFSCCVLAASGQEPKKVIFYNGDPGCEDKNNLVTPEDKIACSVLPTSRGNVSVLTHNGLSIAVAFIEDEKYLLAAVHLANSTETPIMFDPDIWGAAHFKSKEGFRAGEKPMLAEAAIPTRDIIRGMTSGTRLDNSLDTFMADVQRTTETVERRRPDGTRYNVVVIAPDKDAQRAATERNGTRAAISENEQIKIRKSALTGRTIPANGSLKGLVYFRKVKKAAFVVFSIPIDDSIYIFQLLHDRK